MTEFQCRTRIILGEDGLDALQALKAQRLLLVTDPFFVKNGGIQRVLTAAKPQKYQIFDKVEPDPTVMLTAEGTAVAKTFDPDVVVALGGGSALDCAKAMVYFSGIKVCFVAIPTTSGSGSEVTNFAVLTHNSVKHPLVDERLRPDMAILDSAFLKEIPPGLVADTGMDVLAHALEALVAKGASPVTDALAIDAFSTAFAALPASFSGDIAARERMHTASAMAGMAFTQAGLGICHALSHVLGGMYHVPHGRLNAILLSGTIECNDRYCRKKYARLAREAGLGGSADSLAVRNLKNGLVQLRKELSMPATLAQAGIRPAQIWRDTPRIVKAALEDGCAGTNPGQLADFMVRRILDEVTGNG